MEHRRPLRGVSRSWIICTGMLAIAGIASLGLALVCLPRKPFENRGKFSKHSSAEASEENGSLFSIIESNVDAVGNSLVNAASMVASRQLGRILPKTGSKLLDTILPGQCGHGLCKNGTSKLNDFVFATATHQNNEPSLRAGRAGRLGIRTYVSTNYTPAEGESYPGIASETWGYYPDDKPLRSFYGGDTRAALVPFLAYRDLGPTFKWLFYGDDDTLFFVDAAMELVKDLDPEMPYFFSDHFWFANWNYGYPWHPHWRAPRCLPCHSDLDVSTLRMGMVKACPCTPEAMCNLEGGYDNVLDKRTCSTPRAPTITYSMHGGAGALISIGLLKKVSLEELERCVLKEWNTGGDSFITTCLWQAGYGMTDPGPVWHPEGLTRFDPAPRRLIIDHTPYIVPRCAYTIANLVLKKKGRCFKVCQLELDNVLSLHFRGRLLTNTSYGTAALLRGVARLYSFHSGRLQSDDEALKATGDTEDAADFNFAKKIDEIFSSGQKMFDDMLPAFEPGGISYNDKHMQAITGSSQTPDVQIASRQQISWPNDGTVSLFLPNKKIPDSSKGGLKSVILTPDELFKGAAAGVAQRILNDALVEILQKYPPPLTPN